MANEAYRNMQIALVGIEYIYYIFKIADLILKNFIVLYLMMYVITSLTNNETFHFS